MDFYDEQDYLMRIIKELARVLFTLMFGRKYTQVEFPAENKYEVSGIPLSDLTELVDCGDINKAENMLLTNINYTDKKRNLRFRCNDCSAILAESHYTSIRGGISYIALIFSRSINIRKRKLLMA